MLRRIIKFGMADIIIPKVDVSRFMLKQQGWQNDCKMMADSFTKYGLVIIKDPNVSMQQNDNFLNLMERYFQKRSQQYYNGDIHLDKSPQTNYQTGFMHQYQQHFSSYEQQKLKLKSPHLAVTPIKAQKDPKWRFHWKVDNLLNVVPRDFPEWKGIMNSWGYNMKNGCIKAAEMTAIGLGLQADFLTKTIIKGDFMLSPTAYDLQKRKVGDVIAAFHHDFDLMTIHGKARFSGLFAWLNTGQRFLVKVPQGHLLIQAGKQLQWLTGGHIKAGFHEVIYTQQTQKQKIEAIKNNKTAWRISSTLFSQVQSTQILKPHKKFKNQISQRDYPPMQAGDYLTYQLNRLLKQ